jgi:hypothetical protein
MTVRHEIVESHSETGARNWEAGQAPEPSLRRKGGILEQDVDRPRGEPTRVGAVNHVTKRVAATNPRLQ